MDLMDKFLFYEKMSEIDRILNRLPSKERGIREWVAIHASVSKAKNLETEAEENCYQYPHLSSSCVVFLLFQNFTKNDFAYIRNGIPIFLSNDFVNFQRKWIWRYDPS